MINGVFTHETGCPNARKKWDNDSEQWVTYVTCFECGFEVPEGTVCSCHEMEEEVEI